MDHSTNPLSSDLYKIRFKHAAKHWPNGRFANYKEKLDKHDGKIVAISCTRSYPITQKKKKIQPVEQKTIEIVESVVFSRSGYAGTKEKISR